MQACGRHDALHLLHLRELLLRYVQRLLPSVATALARLLIPHAFEVLDIWIASNEDLHFFAAFGPHVPHLRLHRGVRLCQSASQRKS